VARKKSSLIVQTSQKYCIACERTCSFTHSHGDWYCEECGRNEDAARSFQASRPGQATTSPIDSVLELGVKVALLVAFFPFSLLVLVLFYGFDGAAQIVKGLVAGVLRSLFGLVFVIIGAYILLLIAAVLFQGMRGS
jgi:hypothetical protein